jgi:hypothetical protein
MAGKLLKVIVLREKQDKNHPEYIPALRYRWLTTFYDLLIRWTLRESTFKRRLVKQAANPNDVTIVNAIGKKAIGRVSVEKQPHGVASQ